MLAIVDHLSTSPKRPDRRAGARLPSAWLLSVFSLLGFVLVFLPAAATAQGVVVIRARKIAAYEVAIEGFLFGLDRSPPIFDLPASGKIDDALKARIMALKPEVLVGIGSRAAVSLRQRFPDQPLVFSMVLGPEKRGLEGPKITGVRLEIPPDEQFRRFLQVLPKLRRIGVIYDAKRSEALVEEARTAAAAGTLELLTVPVERSSQVPDALSGLLSRVDAIWLIPDATVVTAQTFKHLLLVCLRERIPLLVFSRAFVKAGAFAGVAPDYRALGEATARLVRALLKGEDPAQLPVQDPPSTILVNRRTAERLGLEVARDTIPGLVIVE